MRIGSTLILFLLLVASCKQAAKQDKPYFEGFVESTMSFHTNNAATDSALLSTAGSFATTYIKDSFVSRVYYNDNKVIVAREVFRPDSMKLYEIKEGSDTIIVQDLTNDFAHRNLSMKENGTKKILGKDCKVLELVNEHRLNFTSDPIISNQSYFFDTTVKLIPGIHRGVTYGSYHKIFSKYSFLTMGYQVKARDYEFNMEAKRVVRTNVNPIFFDIPKNKVFVDPYFQF